MTAAREGRVLLFSGHMIDAPDRPTPRFPPALEPAVARAIQTELDRLAVGPPDVTVSSAACGGDLLFAEAALGRGARTKIYLPFDERTFLDASVSFADHAWPERFRAVLARSECHLAPDELGPLPRDEDPFERVNLWMLDEARRLVPGNVVFICVWNGAGGDGPGGTKHMMDAVRSQGGQAVWIDIRRL
jgi:hypothetical protein